MADPVNANGLFVVEIAAICAVAKLKLKGIDGRVSPRIVPNCCNFSLCLERESVAISKFLHAGKRCDIQIAIALTFLNVQMACKWAL